MSRSLDFTACDLPCEHPCWRRLTEEEWEWLETHPNRQAFTLTCIEKEQTDVEVATKTEQSDCSKGLW